MTIGTHKRHAAGASLTLLQNLPSFSSTCCLLSPLPLRSFPSCSQVLAVCGLRLRFELPRRLERRDEGPPLQHAPRKDFHQMEGAAHHPLRDPVVIVQRRRQAAANQPVTAITILARHAGEYLDRRVASAEGAERGRRVRGGRRRPARAGLGVFTAAANCGVGGDCGAQQRLVKRTQTTSERVTSGLLTSFWNVCVCPSPPDPLAGPQPFTL